LIIWGLTSVEIEFTLQILSREKCVGPQHPQSPQYPIATLAAPQYPAQASMDRTCDNAMRKWLDIYK
jgi:hypothetical protein